MSFTEEKVCCVCVYIELLIRALCAVSFVLQSVVVRPTHFWVKGCLFNPLQLSVYFGLFKSFGTSCLTYAVNNNNNNYNKQETR